MSFWLPITRMLRFMRIDSITTRINQVIQGQTQIQKNSRSQEDSRQHKVVNHQSDQVYGATETEHGPNRLRRRVVGQETKKSIAQ
jgi:hypothetical protein